MASFEITWSAPEFEYREKDVSWYWISIIVASLIIAFAVWERNFLFGFFIVIAEILFVAWGNETPRFLDFKMTERDIEIGEEEKSYPMSALEHFSVDHLDDSWSELIFPFKAKLKTPLRIIIPAEKIEEVRKHLKPILKEMDYEPHLLDSLERFIRF